MKCLIEGCERKSKSRGLCVNCYTAAKNVVKAGKPTWGDLERRGLALPSKGGSVNAFTKALAASRDGETAPDGPEAEAAAGRTPGGCTTARRSARPIRSAA